uniref:ATP synthase subunit a n=1 Tax=Hasemania nana TaxID=681919 RepID=U6BZM2_HASNA|nr:ATP synthase F0 subunit 6 [Hasemania nana]BAO02255.1 ATPase subunit 6 [Hasemania nana]
MTLSFFDQYMSPTYLGIPLIAIALTLPWILYPSPSNGWLNKRLITLQRWFINRFSLQLLHPLNRAGHKWALMPASLMILMLSLNIQGLLPYTFTPTTQLSLNMGLTVPRWLATVINGMRNQRTASLGHLLPEGTPVQLIPVLIIIETISLLFRALALGVQLTANLFAGHLLIQLIATAVSVLLPTMTFVALLTFAVLFLLTILEGAVSMIQAFFFVLLINLYLQENI